MATYYVGVGGSDAADGTTWANRKLTLNGAEDIPVAAGDTVYVGPGTYRELLTVDVSGTSGNPITYIGDYTGANTDGTGGVVRITGSDNDIAVARAHCIQAAAQRDYRTFTGFTLDMTSNYPFNWADGSNVTLRHCHLSGTANTYLVSFTSANQAGHLVESCFFNCLARGTSSGGIQFTHVADVDDCGHVVQNCIFEGGRGPAVYYSNIGGATVKNCIVTKHSAKGIFVNSLTAGQVINVNNCVFAYCSTALDASVAGEIIEDYNAFFGNNIDRANTSTGANSNVYPPLLDTRWWFEMVNGGTLVTPFDLASYSELVELNSGTGAPSTDTRGTTVQGTYREWGPLEYDSTLDIEAGAGGASIYRRVARILGG